MKHYVRLAIEVAVIAILLCVATMLSVMWATAGSRATAADKEDPLIATWVSVEVPGYFQDNVHDLAGLGNESSGVRRLVHGAVQVLPGAAQTDQFEVTVGVTNDMGLWKWRALVLQHPTAARKNGTITAYDTQGTTTLAQWTFANAWPSKYEVAVDNSQNGLVEHVWFTCDSITRVK